MLYDYLITLKKTLDLDEAFPNKEISSYSLVFDENLVTIQEASQGFQFICKLGRLPDSKPLDFMQTMLRGNLFGQATKNAHLGLDETGNEIVIQLYYPQKASSREFLDQFEDFLNAIDFWKNELQLAQNQ